MPMVMLETYAGTRRRKNPSARPIFTDVKRDSNLPGPARTNVHHHTLRIHCLVGWDTLDDLSLKSLSTNGLERRPEHQLGVICSRVSALGLRRIRARDKGDNSECCKEGLLHGVSRARESTEEISRSGLGGKRLYQ